MAGRPPPGNPIPKGRGAGSSGPFGQQRQGGGGSFNGNYTAGSSDGGGGSGAGFPQDGALNSFAASGFASGAGFGFNAGPQGNKNNFQQFQGRNGNFANPQASQGGQGPIPPQENFNAGGGFAGNGPRRGGQGNETNATSRTPIIGEVDPPTRPDQTTVMEVLE
jgi:hypothetical protein